MLCGAHLSAASGDETATRRQMSGVWVGYAVEGKGVTPDKGPVKLELTIDETTIKGTESKGGATIDHGQGAYTLDLTQSPVWLDASKTNERGRSESYLGILSVEGDTLKWCVTRQKTRPAQFETRDRAFLLILKRKAPSQP